MARSLTEIDWDAVLSGPFHGSPASWGEQVLYFLLLDRFSDGREDGYLDVTGSPVSGQTPLLGPADVGNAVGTEWEAASWRAAGGTWVGGTLAGLRSKLGYLARLGVSALWISPVLRQRHATDDYHGYGVQDFLSIDPHFGTEDELVDLVAQAHKLGLFVILDVVLNHAGDVFGYRQDQPDQPDPPAQYRMPHWDGRSHEVAGWRDETGQPTLPFPAPVGDRPLAAVWPVELQADGVFTCRGRIVDWDADPQFRQGDFLTYKDIWQGEGSVLDYRPSAALRTLVRCYEYWIARADLDGLRIDTVKHMDPGATRFLASSVHEFAHNLGKENFFLVGEITGTRDNAIELMEATGLDAALGLADLPGRLEDAVKGWGDPQDYFDLFRNTPSAPRGSHTWYGGRVVASIDDHDQVRQGPWKSRFAGDAIGRAMAATALSTNLTTLGIPCIYYGSEQGLDGQGGQDRYLREALFGRGFGAFRTTGRHVFDETHPVYQQVQRVLWLRRQLAPMRVGRQYLREISGDGHSFGLPRRLGVRMTSVVAWSRIHDEAEVVCAFNTDLGQERTAWVTVDAGLQAEVDSFTYRYISAPPAPTDAPVESRNGRAMRITVPPAGFVILTPDRPRDLHG